MATLPDYSIDVEQPFLAAARGFQLGLTTETALQDRALAQQAAQREVQEKQLALQRQQQFQSGISNFFAKPPEQRKYDDLAPLMVGANKQQFDALKQIGDNMTAEKKEASQRFTGQTLLALEANPDVALASLEQRIGAETDPGQKQALGVIRGIAKVDPKHAGVLLEELGAATFGKTWHDGITSARKARRDAELAPSVLTKSVADADAAVAAALTAQATAKNAPEKAAADAALATARANKAKVDAEMARPLAQASLNLTAEQIRKITSEINTSVKKLNLDAQITEATVAEKLSNVLKNKTDLSDATKKLINEQATVAAVSQQSAEQFNKLANRLEAEGGGYGVFSNSKDFFNRSLGVKDAMTQMRQEYTRLRNASAIKALPPGPATDKDIELALRGFPPENADARVIASFLRGMAKMQDIDSAVANAKTDWLASNNGVLTRANKEFTAGNIKANAGESFLDFTKRIVDDVSKKYDPSAPLPATGAGGGRGNVNPPTVGQPNRTVDY